MWMQTHSGIKFDFLYQPSWSEVIEVEDVAHALSMLCRYTGHSKRFYSVAEHVVRGAWELKKLLVDPDLIYAFLHHDDTEAYVGDVSRPLKSLLPTYVTLEKQIAIAVETAFDVPAGFHDRVKDVDNAMLGAEARVLMSRPPQDWGLKPKPHWLAFFRPHIPRYSIMPSWYWKREYLKLHHELKDRR
jgi:hypothetical protein